MIIDLLCILFIVCFIIDYSGFIDEISELITKYFKSPFRIDVPKPFSCSLCMTFWISIIYLICASNLNLINLSLACLFSSFSILISPALVLIREFMNNLISYLNKLSNKIC